VPRSIKNIEEAEKLYDEIVKHKSIEELNAQLVSLVGEDGAQLLVGAFRSRRSISGPELTK
jgi:hypothetical protein